MSTSSASAPAADVNDAAEEPKKKRPLWWRILRIVLLVIAVLLLGALAYIGYLWFQVPADSLNPMKPGAVTYKGTPPATTPVGPYQVAVEAGDKPAVTVTDNTGAVVWRTAPGVAFVSASVNDVSWQEKFGFFWADVNRTAKLTDQTIDEVTPAAGGVQIKGTVSGGDTTAPYTVTLSPVTKSADVTSLGLDVVVGNTNNGQEASSIALTSGLDDSEAVHGFGEQYRDFDLSGEVFPILTQEQGIGRGEQPITFLADLTNWAGANLYTTYAAWPTYVTSANRSFALADVEPSGSFGIADISRKGQLTLESFDGTMKAEALAAATPKELLVKRAAGTTRPPLAGWVGDGAILGLQGGTQKVRQVVSELQAAGSKISGVWLQDWVGKRQTSFGSQLWWTWQLDEQAYPGWDQMVADFNAQGIKVTTYVNPFLADASAKNDPSIRNLYKEAADQGYLIKNEQGQPYVVETVGFPVGMMDFTNPAARDWYAQVIATEVIGKGADGFMADFGEALPFDAVLYEGEPLQQHNRYPELWAQTVRKACDLAGKPECVAWMRSSYLASPQNAPIMWAGDQMVDFAKEDGLASVMLGELAAGVSGAPLWHSDIAGYTSINAVVKDYVRPSNLNARWGEMEAFGVMMRTHETNRPDKNQQVYDTPETQSQFARNTQIFVALKPYREQVIAEAVATGVPAMRHGWLVYPGSKAAGADLQFFLGEHLLVAPVTSNDATSVKVTLPPGTWVHALTGQTFDGDAEVEVDAPIGTPAAFVKQGDPVGDQIRAALQAAGLTTG